MEFTKPFNQLGKKDGYLAGGKGASLGEMTQAGIPVPGGFVVLSTTFDHFLKETDLTQEIDAILKTVDHKAIHTVDAASEKIRGLIESSEVPEDIAKEIREEFAKLGAEFVAVRSSATAEDGAEHAWAGQLESFLNTNEETLLDNVRKCWGSLFTPRAIFYRFEKELHGTDISVAVVVQKMVQSEVSGIAFSVHPITEDYNQLIIEAGYGLGEAIVSGSITPDSYVVEKSPLKIIDKNISDQRKALIKEGKNNNWVMVEEKKRELQKLSDSQILDLSNIIITIENHYGFPCDIEWAYESGKFYIVQSRPITTLSPKSNADIPIKSEDYHFFGLWKCNLFSDWYWCKWLVPEYAQRIGLNLNDGGIFVVNGGYFFTKKSVIETIRQYAKNIIDSRDKEKLLLLKKLTDEIYDTSLSIAERLSKVEPTEMNVREMAEAGQQIMFPWCFGYILSEVFDEFLIPSADKAGVKRQDISSLIPPFKTPLIEAQDNLRAIKQVLEGEGYWSLLLEDSTKAISKIHDDKKVSSLIKKHSDKYGWTTIMNLVGEDLNIEQVIDQITHLPPQHSHTTKHKTDESFEFLIQCASTTAYLRQTGVEYFSIYSRYAQKLLKSSAGKMGITYRELLDLDLNEIVDGINGNDIKEIIEKRKNDNWGIYSVSNNQEPIVLDDSNTIKELVSAMVPKAEASKDGTITGQIGNKGIGEGKVKIILSLEDFHKMEKGDVLVTTMTTPDFVPLMQKASAIITDIGGLLCHAAIISRELNIPCVIGTKFATQVLKDGMEVEVDADNGVVRILGGEVNTKNDPLLLLGAWNVMPLEAWRWFDMVAIERLEKITGTKIRIFTYVKDELHYECVFEKEVNELKEKLDNEPDKKAYLNKIYDDYYKEVPALENYIGKIEKKDVSKFTDKEIAESIQNFANLWITITMQIWYAVFLDIWYPMPGQHKDLKEIAAKARDHTGKLHERSNVVERRLYEEAGKRAGLTLKDVNFLFPQEVIDTLLNKNSYSKEIIERQKFCVTTSISGEYEIYSGKKAEELFEEYNPPSIGTEATDDLKGMIACKGKVRGVVRVIRKDNEFGLFKNGEILVALQTMVHYLPIMEKSVAILTEFGGLTSHAAIVSRELKKPCIVGIPNLLASLKDGMEVEVDADKGNIRIL